LVAIPQFNIDELQAWAARYMSIEENVVARKRAYKAPPLNPKYIKKRQVGNMKHVLS